MHKEIEKAEADGEKYPQGRPNSFLNRLISHGNKKTEDDIVRSSQTNLADTTTQPQGVRDEANIGGAPAGSATSS
ncbi:hypothetical protein K431DRAFT_284700 [Polychaeton citri CBS 116435]|uniref:Uncharacterized protein n=1 Tax=Polychaeton citri CBS 116435 TaxID=1314669 RepID=A0A9P4Q6K3_9PEZI|nr:hypothetical protein K431DRAFT_284700 [Polychaeton citri CBS 116435]